MCHNIPGCSGPAIINNVTKCTTCDTFENFVLINNDCACKNGYKLNNNTKKCL